MAGEHDIRLITPWLSHTALLSEPLKRNVYEGLGTAFGFTIFEEGFYANII